MMGVLSLMQTGVCGEEKDVRHLLRIKRGAVASMCCVLDLSVHTVFITSSEHLSLNVCPHTGLYWAEKKPRPDPINCVHSNAHEHSHAVVTEVKLQT